MGKCTKTQRLGVRRVIVSGVAGAVTLAIAVMVGASCSVSVLVGWHTVAFVFLGWVWGTITKGREGNEGSRTP